MDHRDGPMDAPVSVVHYWDFQCPDSHNWYTVMKKLKETHGDSICYVFRNFPLDFHEYAFHAAQASEIASESGKFWEMYDIMYSNQSNLSDVALGKYAANIGLNPVEFLSALESWDKAKKVELSLADGKLNGVSGTPTFFINGEKYDMSHGEESMELALMAKVAEAL